MPRKKKRLIHLIGEVDVPFGGGKAAVIQTCSGDEPGKLDLVVNAKSGVPLPPGAKIALMRKYDEEHYQCEIIDAQELASSNGPPQVSNLSYRRGWDDTFGRGLPN